MSGIWVTIFSVLMGGGGGLPQERGYTGSPPPVCTILHAMLLFVIFSTCRPLLETNQVSQWLTGGSRICINVLGSFAFCTKTQ